jgi:hypothetical protein
MPCTADRVRIKWLALPVAAMLLGACGGGGGAVASAEAPTPALTDTSGTTDSVIDTTPAPAALPYPTRNAANIFVSGHSLTDDPLAADLADLAASLGKQVGWNEQIVIGSPLRARTSGGSAPPNNLSGYGWPGYRSGKNRNGNSLNVVDELRNGGTLGGGQRYDSLLITERHDLLGTLQYEGTVKFLRHFHDRLNEGRSGSNTYFYQSWLGVSNLSDPRSWIAYERAASPVWQCVATRVNQALVAEGRSDRILSVPANWALAELVERSTQGNVAGVTGSSTAETMSRLFTDDVHLTRLGSYFQSVVSYVALYGSSPVGGWAPSTVSATQAASLQNLAWEVVRNFATTQAPLGLGQCRALLRDSFCMTFWSYRGSSGDTAACKNFFGTDSSANPLFFDEAANAAYWYPAPP